MNTRKFITLISALVVLALPGGCGKPPAPKPVTLDDLQVTNVPATATSAQMTRLDARQGSKIRIEGTSNIHDWQVEGSLIGGFLEAGPNFPIEPGQAATRGRVEAVVQAFIPVRGLKSVEKDGRPYSDTMDQVMCEHLKAQDNPKIFYYLKELVLKEPAKSKDTPYLFDAKGEIVVAGVTNAIAMPVSILPLDEGKLKISGAVSVKMTDFKVEPPSPTFTLGLIKTGDEVKLIFDWMVGSKKPAAAPVGK